MDISAFTVFIQGILSFLSPCVLPLVPLYIGYLSGGTLRYNAVSDTESGHPDEKDNLQITFDHRKVILNTFFFILGICFVFFMLGLGAAGAGRLFVSSKRIITIIGGVLITAFGIIQVFFYGKSRFTSKEYHLPVDIGKMTMSPVTAVILGFTFSFAWTPCIGPVLSSVLMMAASAHTQTKGFLFIGLYTLGFILPFMAVGIFTSTLLNFFKKHNTIVRFTVIIGGILMILTGLLMISGKLGLITGALAV